MRGNIYRSIEKMAQASVLVFVLFLGLTSALKQNVFIREAGGERELKTYDIRVDCPSNCTDEVCIKIIAFCHAESTMTLLFLQITELLLLFTSSNNNYNTS